MSTSICAACNGTGFKTCPACGGGGALISPVKHDHQDIDINPGENDIIMCTQCGGNGQIQCTICSGTGQAHEDDMKEILK